MRIARSLQQLRTLLPVCRSRPLSLVPTMGALHEGHGTLVDRARQDGGFVAVSIFINPLQFGPGEDLEKYPRTEDQDLAFLEKRGADLVFLPSPAEIAPPSSRITVSSGPVGRLYCGRSRPGHFDGVLTIVLKLFHLFSPNRAYFGEKDRQQLFLIGSMVRDLGLPVEILGHPTVREPDGLAMSSRNRYLSREERSLAVEFPRILDQAREQWTGDPSRKASGPEAFLDALSGDLSRAGFRVDYVAMANPRTFLPVTARTPSPEAVLLAAISLGKTRLIDNRDLSLHSSWAPTAPQARATPESRPASPEDPVV